MFPNKLTFWFTSGTTLLYNKLLKQFLIKVFTELGVLENREGKSGIKCFEKHFIPWCSLRQLLFTSIFFPDIALSIKMTLF